MLACSLVAEPRQVWEPFKLIFPCGFTVREIPPRLRRPAAKMSPMHKENTPHRAIPPAKQANSCQEIFVTQKQLKTAVDRLLVEVEDVLGARNFAKPTDEFPK